MNKSTQPSAKLERQRKFFMVLPLLVLPFVTFLLWSIGIIGSSPANGQTAKEAQGLNMHLPDARLKEEKSWNKLNFYEQADRDSVKLKEAMKNDPYFRNQLLTQEQANDLNKARPGNAYHSSIDPSPDGGYKDPSVEKLNKKLAELNTALNKPASPDHNQNTYNANTPKQDLGPINAREVDRLENMLQTMNQKGDADPEMQQLNGMMEKILDLQHPQRVSERLRQASLKNKQAAYAVEEACKKETVSMLGSKDTSSKSKIQNGFYGVSNNTATLTNESHNIEAVVHETQVLVNGATVKLRLVNDVFIGGLLVPKNNFIYGTASLNNERLHISIPSIRYANHLLPVSLEVYDLDGLAGVYIPGSINRDVSKESASEAITGLGVTTLDPSLAAQATSAAVQAAKSLLSRKAKLVKVTVKAGYQVLLKDNNEKQ